MSTTDETSNLPAPIVAAIAGMPAALVPASIKALDRLIGATVDVPVAWLEYQKAKIVSKTESFRTIDQAITKTAAAKAEASEQYADRALDNLVRKSYRQLENKEAVSVAMLEDLHDTAQNEPINPTSTAKPDPAPLDDDWLNVFERYAEDASTERMQKLWGRVLAGEVRTPGKYGMRTLRFLSEFSQADALQFSSLCQLAFQSMVPKSLGKPDGNDIRHLLYMEAAGLIQGTSSGLTSTMTFNNEGRIFLREGALAIMLTGEPSSTFKIEILTLTPLGQELVTLLPGRDPRSAARTVAEAIRRPEIKAAYLMRVEEDGSASPMEILWQEDAVAPAVVG